MGLYGNLDEELNDNRKIVANTPASEQQPAVEEFSEFEKKIMSKNPLWTPERMRAAKKVNPLNGSVIKQYDEIFKKPEIDEETLRRNRTIGIIGDGLKILGQMYGAGKGARIERLDPGQTLTARFAGKEEEARERYRKSIEEWKKGRYGAALQDQQTKNNYEMNLFNQFVADSKHQANWDRDEKRYIADKETEQERYEDTKLHRDKVFEHTVKQAELQNKLDSAKTRAYIDSVKQGKGDEEKKVVIETVNRPAVSIPLSKWESVYHQLYAFLVEAAKDKAVGIELPDSDHKLTAREKESFVLENLGKLPAKAWDYLEKVTGTKNTGVSEKLPHSPAQVTNPSHSPTYPWESPSYVPQLGQEVQPGQGWENFKM
jgi:hypothetical protein